MPCRVSKPETYRPGWPVHWAAVHRRRLLAGHERKSTSPGWAQAVETRLSGLKSNSHWEALHDLDVISRGILRRQKAGNGAGGPRHGFDITIEILAERVHGNSHRLLGMHFS